MSISRQLHNQVMMLDNFTCVYYGYYGSDVTIDHYIPASLGGPNVIQNLVAACISCNSHKSDRAPYEAGMIPRFERFSRVEAIARTNQRQAKRQHIKATVNPPPEVIGVIQVLYLSGHSKNQIAQHLQGTKQKRLAIIDAALEKEPAA